MVSRGLPYICLDDEGRSLFLELLGHRGVEPFRYAFDLLWLDGDDLRGMTLIEPAPRPKKRIPSLGFKKLAGYSSPRFWFTDTYLP